MNILKKLGLSNILNNMNSITINGESFVCDGKNIVAKNGSIYVDGIQIKTGLSGNVTVHFNGDLATLNCADAVINGNVQGDVNAADVRCGDVGGNVSAADVRCNNVRGKVSAASVKMRKDKV